MISIHPIRYEDLEETCGKPGSEQGFVKLKLPFPMMASWDENLVITNLYAHSIIAEAVIEALEEIEYIYGMAFIRQHKLDIFGGAYANRNMRRSLKKSVHAWGMAFDYCPDLGELGEPSMMPYQVVNAFLKRGFNWGGLWDVQDGMHFTAVIE